MQNKYKTEWHYKTEYGPSVWYLKVDENSTKEELEAEIDYWMEEIQLYEVSGDYKKSLMAAIRWMARLVDELDGI